MKTKINFIQQVVIVCGLFLLMGCQDYLDVKPESVWESDNFYSTPDEAEIALAGIYGVLASDKGYGRDLIILNAGTDEYFYNRRFNENWGVSVFRNTPSDDESFNFWTDQYQAINLANLFLESIKRSSFDTDSAYNALVAEARFIRGLCYFNLSNFWEEIPLRLSSSKNQSDNNEPAASLEAIYDAIIADFTFASINLPHPSDGGYIPGRAHKLAAHGFLARVYLKMSGYPLKGDYYQEAMDQCEAVINDGYPGLEMGNGTDGYRSLFLDIIGGVYNLKENLFEISFQNLRDQGITSATGRLGGLNGLSFEGGGALGDPNGYAMAGVYPTLSGLFDQDNDKRYDWNIASYFRKSNGDIQPIPNELTTRKFCPAKYRRWEPLNYEDIDITGTEEPYVVLENSASQLNRNFTSVNFPVLRYSDVLLMYAEAANEVAGGPTPLAIQYLNQVRERAGLQDITIDNPSAVSSKTSFFNELVNERSRELCFEGVRRNDLIRWELLDDKLVQIKNVVEGHPNFIATSGDQQAALRGPRNFDETKHLSLPYPLVEVNINGELDQKIQWQ